MNYKFLTKKAREILTPLLILQLLSGCESIARLLLNDGRGLK